MNFQFNNLTGVAQPNARFTAQAVITIESEVLDDPALIDPQSLIGSGLSASQANQFFNRPITLTFGARGTVQIVDGVSYFYGIRLYGDK